MLGSAADPESLVTVIVCQALLDLLGRHRGNFGSEVASVGRQVPREELCRLCVLPLQQLQHPAEMRVRKRVKILHNRIELSMAEVDRGYITLQGERGHTEM